MTGLHRPREDLKLLLNTISSHPPRTPFRTSATSFPKLLQDHYIKFLIVFVIFAGVYYWYYCYYLPPEYPPFIIKSLGNIKTLSAGHDPKQTTEAWCENVPKLEPFHESIKYLTNVPSKPQCLTGPLLFNSTRDSIIPLKTPEEFEKLSIKRCCYKVIKREYGAKYGSRTDDRYGYSMNCLDISLKTPTKIKSDQEFIAVHCTYAFQTTMKTKRSTKKKRLPWEPVSKWKIWQNYTSYKQELVDMIPFVHLKEKVEAKLKNIKTPSSAMNVLILGFDAVSHMNFVRTFAKSHRFLLKNMSAIEMNWYNKVGDNTYPNVVPAVTGRSATEIDRGCAKRKRFDSCPFIWKNYSQKGYRTALVEDSPGVAIFNHEKLGFDDVPTDYYLRPYSLAADARMGKFARIFVKMCHGQRLVFEGLMGYTKKFVETMDLERKLYFYFMWGTSLTHDGMNDGYFGDQHLLETLQWLKEGHLDNTILILLSDHGRRFGEIRSYLQGQLEDRLPLMYFILPKMFQRRYNLAYQNLKNNGDSLVTTFDFHETLKDILDLDKNLSNENIWKRHVNATSPPRGISMFLPIPSSRTCDQAGVPRNFCACNKMKPVRTEERSVKSGASVAVVHMNKLVAKHKQCIPLNLTRIVSALKVGTQFNKWEAYQLRFETMPGNGSFEALVAREFTKSWHISGTIERTNTYGNQSSCVHDIKLKYYCYCRNKD